MRSIMVHLSWIFGDSRTVGIIRYFGDTGKSASECRFAVFISGKYRFGHETVFLRGRQTNSLLALILPIVRILHKSAPIPLRVLNDFLQNNGHDFWIALLVEDCLE